MGGEPAQPIYHFIGNTNPRPHAVYLIDAGDALALPHDRVRNCRRVLDQLHVFFDARQQGSGVTADSVVESRALKRGGHAFQRFLQLRGGVMLF